MRRPLLCLLCLALAGCESGGDHPVFLHQGDFVGQTQPLAWQAESPQPVPKVSAAGEILGGVTKIAADVAR